MNRVLQDELVEQVAEVLASGATPRQAAMQLRIDERVVRRIAGRERGRGRKKRPRPRRRKKPSDPPRH